MPGAHEVGQRAERLVDVGVLLGPVDLVQVDPVGAEPAQAVLDFAHDPAARVAELVRVVAHRAVHLGREHDVVAPAAGSALPDDLLGLAARVDVGGVDEVDARVERAVDDPDALVVVRLPQAPNIIAPRQSGLTLTPVGRGYEAALGYHPW